MHQCQSLAVLRISSIQRSSYAQRRQGICIAKKSTEFTSTQAGICFGGPLHGFNCTLRFPGFVWCWYLPINNCQTHLKVENKRVLLKAGGAWRLAPMLWDIWKFICIKFIQRPSGL